MLVGSSRAAVVAGVPEEAIVDRPQVAKLAVDAVVVELRLRLDDLEVLFGPDGVFVISRSGPENACFQLSSDVVQLYL